MRRSRHATAGYTLAELLVVLAIMGMLAIMTIPLVSASRPGVQARAAAQTVAQNLVAARQAAINGSVEQHVVLMAGRYAILPAGVQRTVPKGVSLAMHSPAQGIVFYPDGSTSGGSIVVSSASARHRVTVSWPSGRISVDE